MTDHRTAFLPRLVAHIRGGKIFELAGPSVGHVAWTACRLRLALDQADEIEFQIQIEIRLRSGLISTSQWSPCHWTIEELLSLRDEADHSGVVSSGMDEAERGQDPLVDDLMDLMAECPLDLAGVEYVLDDDSISVFENGHLGRVHAIRHPAQNWIADRLDARRAAVIAAQT